MHITVTYRPFLRVLLFIIGLLPAARAADLETTLTASLVKGPITAESYSDAAAAAPGDVIRYVATFTNTTAKTIREVAASLPIPRNLELQLTSVTPAATEGSIDGKTFVPLARLLKPKAEGGLGVAPASIRVLRWAPRDLAAAGSFSVEARAKVATAAAQR